MRDRELRKFTPDRTTRIRHIFLERKRRYSFPDVVRLTGVKRRDVIAGIRAGDYGARRERGQYHFTWSELAHIAMTTWPLPIINDALGLDAVRALPRLLLLQDLRVHLPGYQVLMLHRLAQRASVDLDSYLSNYFLDLAGAEVAALEADIPGFAAAMRFPDGESR
jgi:hypothetical protein